MNDLVAQELPKGLQEPGVVAGATVKSLIPTTLEGVWRVANILVRSPFVPKDLNTVEACASAIMLGLDVGLNPIQAVQSIAVINGRPSIWGDAALALCLAHPLCEDVVEDFSGDLADETTWLYTCTAKRKGRQKLVVATFSYADAQKAGLLGKSGPWQQYRRRMIQLRARAFCLRDAFPDILKGLAIREEMEDVDVAVIRGRAEPPKPPGLPAHDAETGEIIDAEAREVKGDSPASPKIPDAAEEKASTEASSAPPPEEKKPEPKQARRKPNGWPALLETAEFAVDDGLCVKDTSGTYQAGQKVDPRDMEDADLVLENNVIVRRPGDPKPGDETKAPAVDHIAEIKRFLQAAKTMEELNGVIPKGATTDLAKAFDAASPEQQNEVKAVYAARKAELTAPPQGDQQQGGAQDGYDPSEALKRITASYDHCDSLDSLETCQNSLEELIETLSRSDREKAQSLYDAAEKRIQKADEQDGAKASAPAAAEKQPDQMTGEEYFTYCHGYLTSATSWDQIKPRWFPEGDIRSRLVEKSQMTDEQRSELRTLYKKRESELRPAS